jgi:hypothetical protein
MRYHAADKDPGAGTVWKYDDVWDYDMIQGCKCDREFFGADCMNRRCPVGDDPLTGRGNDVLYVTGGDPLNTQYDEVQTIFCKASGGKFLLSFRQIQSQYINWDDSAEIINIKFNQLRTVRAASLLYAGITATACTPVGNTITVTFGQDFGDLPLIVFDSFFLECIYGACETPSMTAEEKVRGTKEDMVCSNRGICDVQTGVCTCSSGYETSNGKGGRGAVDYNRGDCGFAKDVIVSCPGEVSCSGHGVCRNLPTYKCICSDGWTGADCSEMSCRY